MSSPRFAAGTTRDDSPIVGGVFSTEERVGRAWLVRLGGFLGTVSATASALPRRLRGGRTFRSELARDQRDRLCRDRDLSICGSADARRVLLRPYARSWRRRLTRGLRQAFSSFGYGRSASSATGSGTGRCCDDAAARARPRRGRRRARALDREASMNLPGGTGCLLRIFIGERSAPGQALCSGSFEARRPASGRPGAARHRGFARTAGCTRRRSWRLSEDTDRRPDRRRATRSVFLARRPASGGMDARRGSACTQRTERRRPADDVRLIAQHREHALELAERHRVAQAVLRNIWAMTWNCRRQHGALSMSRSPS